MPKTLGIWEWGCPKRGDAQNAVTPPPYWKARKPWGQGCVYRVSVQLIGAVSQWTVMQDFLLSFTFAELLFMCLFAMEKGQSFVILSS